MDETCRESSIQYYDKRIKRILELCFYVCPQSPQCLSSDKKTYDMCDTMCRLFINVICV